MRVTFASGQAIVLADLEAAAETLMRRQRDVSSGSRLHAPNDDPSGWAAAIRERGDIATVDQYVRTADSATSRLQVVDTVLSAMISKLTAARSTLASGLGTIQTTEQREAIAQQLDGLRNALFDDLTATFGGTYLFSGGNGLVAPYSRDGSGTISAYHGDASPISLDVDRNRAVQVTFDGSALAQGSESQDVLTTLGQIAAAVRAGDQTAMTDGLAALERAFDRVVRTQSGVGASLNAIEDQRSRLGQMKLAGTARLSKTEDANMAESITAMQQANTAYQSALGAIATRSQLSLLDYLK